MLILSLKSINKYLAIENNIYANFVKKIQDEEIG